MTTLSYDNWVNPNVMCAIHKINIAIVHLLCIVITTIIILTTDEW